MAESKNNIVTHGLSGKLGDLIVFRQRAGKTILSSKPKERTGEPSAAQQQVRERFQQAIIYGKAVLADAASKSAYEAAADGGKSAYNVAVADFFNAPDIHEVDVTGYTGATGSKIRVKITDDFEVKSVRVKIENPDNTLVEEGAASLDANGIDWFYTATVENTPVSGDKITITATDLPRNTSVKDTVLS